MSLRILGINDGYASSACLLVDGKIEGMVGEERFNRIKSYGGPPVHTVEWLLENNGLSPDSIHSISVVGRIEPIASIEAFTKGRHRLFSALARVLPLSVMSSDLLAQTYSKIKATKRNKLKTSETILKKLSITPKDVTIVDHHEAHAYSAYYASGFQNKHDETLVITCDGSGDGICCSISIGNGYEINRISTIPSYNSFGILYSRLTQFLGMKPLEHEYKVMGLAPYAPDRSKQQAYDILKDYFSLDNERLSFVNHSSSWGSSMVRKLQRDLYLIRFDGVAAAIQQLFEELFMTFVLSWVKKTGIRRLVLGGGSFMNVKFNMLLLNRQEIGDIFFLPSGGDESIALGAAYFAYLKLAESKGISPSIEPIGPLYFGHELSEEEILASLEKHTSEINFEKCENVEARTARLIAEDNIVGRVRGKMEWGARALGNRSIVASPKSLNTVRKINAAIKMRDFWMPFAPSILWERRNDYILNPRDFEAPYMIVAFESTELAKEELMAGLHPFDLTCRPQLVRREWNPLYHLLLKEFESNTGIGGILNTSFNLHGDAIVMTAEDAIYTLINSGLDYITLEDYLVWRR